MKISQSKACILAYTIILGLVLSLTSCDPVTDNPPTIEIKDKTVLLYFVANNNLSGNAKRDLEELKQGYIPQDDNLLVYYHTTVQTPILLHIYKGEDGQIVQDTTYRFPDRNSASEITLNSVLKITQTMYPAKNYGLVLWSHGTGWLPKGYYSNLNSIKSEEYIDPYAHLVKSFGSDDGVEMDIPALAKALPYKLEFVIFDACLMSGIETAYELKDSVSYIIASPTETLTDGLPYDKITEHMFANPINATAIVDEYYDFYNSKIGSEQSGTIAAIKTSELENVAAQAKVIFEKYRDNIYSLDLTKIQRYFRGNKYWFYDISDFMNTLAPGESSAFNNALNKAIIDKAATQKFLDITIDPNKYSGLSIYIPQASPDSQLIEFYKNFKWNTDSKYFVNQ